MNTVQVSIDWFSYDNDDISDEGETVPPDEGWYVNIRTPDGIADLGKDYFGDGFASLDEALAKVRKWATDRGFCWDAPSLDFPLVSSADRDAILSKHLGSL